MSWQIFILLIIGGLSFTGLVLLAFAKTISNRIRREEKDKVSELHTFRVMPPTWRFQKYHPRNCSHKNGIYRNVTMKQVNETVKKSVFVCADCISIIEIEDLKK